MRFNNVSLFKPLCAGQVAANGVSQLSVGRVGFTSARPNQGQYVITFASALPDANYVVSITNISGVLTSLATTITARTAQSFSMSVVRTNGTGNDMDFTFVIFN